MSKTEHSTHRNPALSFRDDTRRMTLPARLATDDLFDPNEETLIFLHIPKSAGTTLDFALRGESLPGRRRYLRFVVDPNRFNPPIWVSPGWTGSWEAAVAAAKRGPIAAQVITGHFPFGVHRITERKARYITMIREPVSREISNFNFHYQRGYLGEDTPPEIMLDPERLLDNPQTRMLAGVEAMQGDCDEAVYARAIANLDAHFIFVAPVAEAQNAMSATLALLGAPPVGHYDEQITRIKLLNEPSDTLRSALRERHRFDVRLFEEVGRRWAAWSDEKIRGLRAVDDYHYVVVIPDDFMRTASVYLMPASRVRGKSS